MIKRKLETRLKELAKQYPVVTVTGPRQAGKTTLARMAFPKYDYVNLEVPDVRAFAREDPRGFLAQHAAGAILDEIQRVPELLSYIQGIVDEERRAGQFILTGSQQFEMMRALTQSLAGRTALLRLLPFSLEETSDIPSSERMDDLLYRGFYPRVLDRSLNPTQAYGDYVATYVDRDLRQISRVHDLGVFETFLRLTAGRVGQLLNCQNLAADVGISHSTAREWLDILETSYIVYRLRPYHANLGKRLVKTPKIYFHDVGLAAYLIGIEAAGQIRTHPLRGGLFENLVVTEALKFRCNRGLPDNLFYYRDSNGNEVDLLQVSGDSVVPIEIKAGQTISSDYFNGLQAFARATGREDVAGTVVYGGDEEQKRKQGVVVPITKLLSRLAVVAGAVERKMP